MLVRRFPETFPGVYTATFMTRTGFGVAVTPLRDWVVGDAITRGLWILLASVALVFIVAAANVANLFLVRLDARRREIAMRVALGAARGQLAVHFLAEGLVLSAAAATLGVALAVVGLRALLASAPDGIPRLGEVALSWPSVVVAAGLALVTGVVFALVPIASARVNVLALREGSRTLTAESPAPCRAWCPRCQSGGARARAARGCRTDGKELSKPARRPRWVRCP